MQRKVVLAEGEFYHLYSRGVDKRIIFLDQRDYRRFLKLLYVANGTEAFIFRDIENKALEDIERGDPLVAIGAYTLMPNHFHILVKETRKDGISVFMKKLLTGYSTYFNKRHGRTGTLFQSAYQASHADSDRYLKYLFSYIHLNQIKLIKPNWKEKGIGNKNAAKQFLLRCGNSSYLDYTGHERTERLILSAGEFPEYFSQPHEFSEFIDDWLTLKPDNT